MDLRDVKKKDKIYTMMEVAKFMGISYITLYRLVKGGKIKVVNVAKSGKKPIFGFTAQDVQTYYNAIPGASNRPKRIDE